MPDSCGRRSLAPGRDSTNPELMCTSGEDGPARSWVGRKSLRNGNVAESLAYVKG
jgi:hypothetical protein